jgi:hypothetical protein
MPWRKRVERLRDYVLQECKDIPPDLMLAIINNESAGKIGEPGKRKTKSKDYIPTVNGGKRYVDIAYGLTQAVPSTILFYNSLQKKSKYRATFEDVSGTDERAARIQIRIGCFLLAFINKYLHDKFPSAAPAISLSDAKPDQIKLVLTGYSAGHGNTDKRLTALQSRNITPSFESIEKTFSNWGRNKNGEWINRPIQYANKISREYAENRGGSFVEPGAATTITNRISNIASKGGWMWLGVAGILAIAYYKNKGSK